MATPHVSKGDQMSQLLSAGQRHPPPPPTPYLTEKILTLASSCERNADGENNRQRGPPVSPTDSVAQAMKNDLEELIGYIDNLAFERKDETSVEAKTKTTSTNKQLFPRDKNITSIGYETPAGNRNVVFRDRTNRFVANAGQNNLLDKLEGPQVAAVQPRPNTTGATKFSTEPGPPMNSINKRKPSQEQEPKMLDPVGNLPKGEEPAGSPPSQDISLYFHDESLSLNLSQSQDANNSTISDLRLDAQESMIGQHREEIERPTRLLSTLEKNELVSSPERSRAISFVPISKDPTPSKAIQSTSALKNDAIDEDESEFKLAQRVATPFPRNHNSYADRLEQENLGRKGKEWWRVRSTPPENLTRKETIIRSNSKDDSSVNENNDSKSLKWMDNVTSPLRRPQYSLKGTPHPSGPRGDIGSSLLQTPVQHQADKSNLVLTSPESAKKLLRSAIEALQDARKERDEAREWADDIKKSVNEWVEDQRRLIRTESSSISRNSNSVSTAIFEHQHKVIEQLINDLRREIKDSKSDTETQLQRMMLKQDEQIGELSRQLASVKEQLSRFMKEDTAPKERDPPSSDIGRRGNKFQKSSRLNNVDATSLAQKTPTNGAAGLVRSASRSEASHASSRGSHRTRRSTPNGGHLIDYGNGVTKELHPDGTTVTRFQNGDVETRFGPNTSTSSSKTKSSSCMVAYYHCKEEVLQITQRDGSILYEYSNGQVERHCADGTKIILFPDGTKTIV